MTEARRNSRRENEEVVLTALLNHPDNAASLKARSGKGYGGCTIHLLAPHNRLYPATVAFVAPARNGEVTVYCLGADGRLFIDRQARVVFDTSKPLARLEDGVWRSPI